MATAAAQLGKELLALLLATAAKELGKELAEKLSEVLSTPHFAYSTPHPGAPWISCVDGTWGFKDGTVFSAYFHPTKEHRATTVGALGQKRSQAKAGTWAVSMQTKGAALNKAFYDTEPFENP
jgi:hypothetical protein